MLSLCNFKSSLLGGEPYKTALHSAVFLRRSKNFNTETADLLWSCTWASPCRNRAHYFSQRNFEQRFPSFKSDGV